MKKVKKVRQGYKMTELGEVPEEWEERTLSDITSVITKGTTPTTYGYNFEDKGINFIKIESINDISGVLIKSTFSKISEECHRKLSRSILEKDDILFAIAGATIGKCAVVESDFLPANTNQALAIIRLNESVDNKYVFHQLRGPLIQSKIENLKTNTAQPNLNLKQIGEFTILLPTFKEQQKIATILSSVDEQIEITDNLIEKTKELKKGLMQRLFTKGIGHKKFKDTETGRIPEEWEVKTLGDITNGKGEYGIGASATEFIEGNPRYLRISDIGNDSALLNEDIKGFDNSIEYDNYILQENDIVFARTGNTTGKTYLYDKKHGKLVYAGFLIRFKINEKIAYSRYVKYFTQTKTYWDWVSVMSTRSGQPGINSNEYSKLNIPIPSLEEQQKIALILSSVDNQIEEYESRKEKLEELKKGLMQKLLTGKIRVKA